MVGVNFCPYCDASQHKVVEIKDERIYFCKECNRFFRNEILQMKCKKCESTNIVDSEFPSPDGQMVFQCRKCKKMYPAVEFFKFNKVE